MALDVVTDEAISRLRAICLALPEATERLTWDAPTFRVREKIFAMCSGNPDTPSVWCKAPPGVQAILVGADPERFFKPPYLGHKGWIGVRLDVEVDWDELSSQVEESYRMTAPRKLIAALD